MTARRASIDSDVTGVDKPYVCPRCAFRTTNKGNLTRHLGSAKCEQRSSSSNTQIGGDEEEGEGEGEEEEEGGPQLAVLAASLSDLADAITYQQQYTLLKRHAAATQDALAAARRGCDEAADEKAAAAQRLRAAEKAVRVLARASLDAGTALAAMRVHLKRTQRERGIFLRAHDRLANIEGELTRCLQDRVAQYRLPQGTKIVHTVSASYMDEHGCVDSARVNSFIDRIAPDLRGKARSAEAAAELADKAVDALNVVLFRAVAKETWAQQEVTSAREAVNVATVSAAHATGLVAYFENEMTRIRHNEQRDFLDPERTVSGAFATLSPRARQFASEVRHSPELVRNVGDLTSDLLFGIPCAMVSREPFVFNDRVLSRDGAFSSPLGNTCALCGQLAAAGNPLVLTPCNHLFHVSCFNGLYANKRAHYEQYRKGLSATVPCPQCKAEVANTDLVLVTNDRYFF